MIGSNKIVTGLIRLWPWFHLIALIAVILQPSTPAVILGRFSKTSIAVLIILLVSLPVVVWVSRWVIIKIERNQLPVHPRLYPLIFVVNGLLLVLVGRLAATVTNSYVVLSVYISYLLLTTLVWSLIQTSPAQHLKFSFSLSDRFATLVCGAVCLILFAIAIHFPGQLWTDEGYNTSLAISIAHDGKIAVPIFRLTPELYGPVYSLVYFVVGAVYEVFGVTLGNGRLVIYGIGLFSLFCVGRACIQFYSAAATRVAVVLAAFGLLVINYLRADVEVALCLSLALWAFGLAHKTGQRRWHIGVGLAVGFCLDGHPNAYRFIIAFAAAYFMDYLTQSWNRKRLLFYHPIFLVLIGLAVGLFGYVALYTVLAPDSFSTRLQSTGLVLNFSALFPQMAAQLIAALQSSPILLASAVFGLGIGLKRRSVLDRLVIIVLLVSSLWLSVGYGYYRTYYFVHSLPLFIILAASAFDYLEQQFQASRASVYLNFLLLFVVITSSAWLSAKIGSNRSQDYGQSREIADQIRTFVPPQETFIGADPLYLRMYDYPKFVEFNTGIYMALRDQIDERTAWEKIGAASVAIMRDYPIQPPASLLAYLQDNHFTRVHCWEGDKIGHVDLYMKTIPSGVTPSSSCDIVSTDSF